MELRVPRVLQTGNRMCLYTFVNERKPTGSELFVFAILMAASIAGASDAEIEERADAELDEHASSTAAPHDAHHSLLLGLLRAANLTHHKQTLHAADLTMSDIMDTPTKLLTKQLLSIGFEAAEVQRLIESNRAAEDAAVAWDKACTLARR